MSPSRKGPITFVVVGTDPFPVDMLRYDGCYPRTSEDAVALAASCDTRGRPERRRITLRSQLGAFGRPTDGRWRSFGWAVEEVRYG